MKTYLLLFVVVSLLAAGCGKEEPEPAVPASAAKTPSNMDLAVASAATPAPLAPGAVAPAAVSNEPIAPELAPVQQGIEAFKTQNNRLPNNVEEMVAKKIIPALPKLPPGKIYYIDHATGRVHVNDGP